MVHYDGEDRISREEKASAHERKRAIKRYFSFGTNRESFERMVFILNVKFGYAGNLE